MGRGKKWSSKESERVTIAWSQATHDPVVGRNQSGDTFDEKVYLLFSWKPPKDADPGTYNDRSHPSMMTCLVKTPQKSNYSRIKKDKSRPSCYLRCTIP